MGDQVRMESALEWASKYIVNRNRELSNYVGNSKIPLSGIQYSSYSLSNCKRSSVLISLFFYYPKALYAESSIDFKIIILVLLLTMATEDCKFCQWTFWISQNTNLSSLRSLWLCQQPWTKYSKILVSLHRLCAKNFCPKFLPVMVRQNFVVLTGVDYVGDDLSWSPLSCCRRFWRPRRTGTTFYGLPNLI